MPLLCLSSDLIRTPSIVFRLEFRSAEETEVTKLLKCLQQIRDQEWPKTLKLLMRESTFVISSIYFEIYSKNSYNLSELTTGIQSACPQMERVKAAELREPLMTKTFKRLSFWYHRCVAFAVCPTRPVSSVEFARRYACFGGRQAIEQANNDSKPEMRCTSNM